MRHFKRCIVWIVPIAFAVVTPACGCGAHVGPVHAGAGVHGK
jgi:hypothetical protein